MPVAPALDKGGAAHLRPGISLPPIALTTTIGPDVCLADHPGRGLLIIYPWTGRPGEPNPPDWDAIPGAHGSTPELEGFRDLATRFGELGVALFGLSRQPSDYQREMAARLGLPFPILSDVEGRFAGALALPSFATGGETYLKRLTLVIAVGCIEAVFYPVPDPTAHPSVVLRWLERKADGPQPEARA